MTNIQHFCLDDGPGIRTTVFMAGCNLRCLWCHNPEAIMKDLFDHTTREIFADELFEEICEDKLFYEQLNGGVTFSGGEPILQSGELTDVLNKCKENDIHVAVETAANYSFDLLKSILEYIDLLIVDCKAISNEDNKKCTGRSNEAFIENFKILCNEKRHIWVRIPIVWNVNISIQEIHRIGEFLQPFQLDKVELIPYHKMGIPKYKKYKIEYLLQDVTPPTIEQLETCRDILSQYGIIVSCE